MKTFINKTRNLDLSLVVMISGALLIIGVITFAVVSGATLDI